MHLAQLDIARPLYPLDAPQIKDFVDNLEFINGIAEHSPGFIWRLQDESGDATAIQAFEAPEVIVNMSVWTSPEMLKDFMFKTAHRSFFRRKAQWFERMPQASYVLWWIPEGHIPPLPEALARLEYLRQHGESPFAFSFKQLYPASAQPDTTTP
ncbi:DUF3291 domain-containing protein [Bowmanella dokdonensis]|uniref:DUF3291 domain-containing protein n=1 Tax=Bowmanella dokdonensis TaxID=751969 RepID=A0A939IPL8_9ALTE|nr:DUF3291 domain-containing protein [Bowmanella dokdonensis]MBN7827578.1 DUF3291 domain-containing protein [Bowmanella dokdonensis]